MKIIRVSKRESLKDNTIYIMLALCELFSALIVILSLGFLTSDLRAKLLFSDWLDNFAGYQDGDNKTRDNG